MKGPRIRKYLGFLVMTLALILAAGQVKAGYIDDRNVLDTLLGPSAPGENFESFSVDPEGYFEHYDSPLSSVTAAGVQFVAGPDNDPNDSYTPALQLNDAGWAGQPSKDLGAWYSKSLLIDFTGVPISETEPGVIAFGLDLLVFESIPFVQNNTDNATIIVYGNDDSVLFQTEDPISLLSPSSPVFFGFFDESGTGIKEVKITGEAIHPGSPIIDNLTFGTQVVPIPGAVWLLGSGLLGLVALRKKFK